ncbi:MAG: HEAT repeat domain-containing protein [Candidatus Schekmanbacteria bacterium]|nr:HEAT repeat domain-containing protein [Candidatus Schekmanbacteria bacterium]
MRLYYVDPDPVAVAQWKPYLAGAVVELLCAESQAEALALMLQIADSEATERKRRNGGDGDAGDENRTVTAIILECEWPGRDPLDVVRAFKISFPFQPIIVFTAVDDRRLRLEGLREGVTGFLDKKSTPAEVSSRIEHLLSNLSRTFHHRQRHVRVVPAPEAPVPVRLMDANGERFSGLIQDVSLGGCSALFDDLPDSIASDDELPVEFALPGIRELVTARIKVVRSGRRLVRGQFLDLSPRAKSHFEAYVLARLNNQTGVSPPPRAEPSPRREPATGSVTDEPRPEPSAPEPRPEAGPEKPHGEPAELAAVAPEAPASLDPDLVAILRRAEIMPAGELRRKLEELAVRGGAPVEHQLVFIMQRVSSLPLKAGIIEVMGNLGTDIFVPVLEDLALNERRPGLFERIVTALGRIGGANAERVLERLMVDESNAVRQRLVSQQLKSVRVTDPVEFFLHRLERHADNVRIVRQVVDAMGRIGASAADRFIDALNRSPDASEPGKPQSSHVQALIASLGEIGSNKAIPAVLGRFNRKFGDDLKDFPAQADREEALLFVEAFGKVLAKSMAEAGQPPLYGSLGLDADTTARLTAIAMKAAQQEDLELRYLAIPIAGLLSDSPDFLAEKLEDSEWGIRLKAVEGLGHMAARSLAAAFPYVVKGCGDNHLEVRRAAMAILSLHPAGTELIIGLLSSPDWRQREQAALELGHNSVSAATPDLLKLLTDPQDQVRSAALDALSRIGGAETCRGIAALLPVTHGEIRSRALETLVMIGGSEAIVGLAPLLEGRREPDREAMRTAIRIIGPAKGLTDEALAAAVRILRLALDGDDVVVRDAAKCLFSFPYTNETVAQDILSSLEKTALHRPEQRLSLNTRDEVRATLQMLKRRIRELRASGGEG